MLILHVSACSAENKEKAKESICMYIKKAFYNYKQGEQHIDVTNYIIHVIIYITSLYDVNFLTQLGTIH